MLDSKWVPSFEEFKPNWFYPSAFRKAVVRFVYAICLSIVVLLFIEVTLRSLEIHVTYPEEVKITVLVGTVGPVLLSSLLVYLYYQQQKILSQDHRSDVSVNRFIGASEDKIRLRITNSGSGAVQRLFLRVNIDFDDGSIVGRKNYLELKSEESDGSRTFLKPYESVIFSKKVLLPLEFPNESNRRIPPFGMGMRFAGNHGATSGHLKLTLVWVDAIQTGEITVFDEDFEVNDIEDFSTFLDDYPEHSAHLMGGLD